MARRKKAEENSLASEDVEMGERKREGGLWMAMVFIVE